MKHVIDNIRPVIEQASIAASNSPSSNESVNTADVEGHALEGESIANAFSVVSRYFQSISNQIQVVLIL